jgi:hypothetical protein
MESRFGSVNATKRNRLLGTHGCWNRGMSALLGCEACFGLIFAVRMLDLFRLAIVAAIYPGCRLLTRTGEGYTHEFRLSEDGRRKSRI